jgi:succinate dehydrogenase/fumarate reductase flavoprotein subunit
MATQSVVDGRSVVVVGSGAAGLAAALGAAAGGAEVVVLEADHTVGGTTALSGGVVWIPANEVMTTAGRPDSVPAAQRYLRELATGAVDAGLMDTFAADAARVAAAIEKATPLQWECLEHWPDYHAELAGGRAGGRSLWPRTLTLPAAVNDRIHAAPDQPTVADQSGAQGRSGAAGGEPGNDGVVFRGPVRGRALVGALLLGLADAGIEIRTGTRVTGLVVEGGAVTGVEVDGAVVAGRVVLATGGFQHDAGLVASYLGGLPVAPMGTPASVGDGLRLALSVGAAVANTAEGWWMPALSVPDETLDGARYFRPLHSERAYPGAIMVAHGSGRRFVNEAQNYGDVGRAMIAVGGRAWLLFDGRVRRHYPIGPVGPGDPEPAWLQRAARLDELDSLVGAAPGTLATTVAEFNVGAAVGADPLFGRGSLPYDRWIGDPTAPHPTLAPLDEAPFFALDVHLGCMGTKGGPVIDDRGRVKRADGAVVAGLYAAGNVAANPFGAATPAGGGTLGPALVFGYRAGEAAAGDQWATT